MLLPPPPVITDALRWELKDPSPATEDSSIIDVAMGVGEILFLNSKARPPKETV